MGSKGRNYRGWRGGLQGCRERASAANFQMASQHPGLPPAHRVTLVLEAETSEGNVVSKVLFSYYMCLL